MGLKNQAEFEKPNETQTATETATETKDDTMKTKTNPAADKAAAGAEASTAIATAAASAVAVHSKPPVIFAHLLDAMPVDTVQTFARVAPAVTAEGGQLKLNRNGQKEKLGKTIRVRPVSFNHRWMAVPGSNDKEAKEFVRSSYDKVNLDDGSTSLDGYVAELQAKGYDKAHVEPYIDLWCDIVWTEAKGDIAVEEQELTRLQLSKTSIGNWNYFCANRGRLEKAGLVAPLDVVEVQCEDLEGKSGSYSNMSFHAPKA